MNEKEISEIRRRLRPDKNNITGIRGCYVNEKREIISLFSQSLALMPQEESEEYLSLFKRTLSGTLDKNLIDISFSTQQVVDSEEHKLLMALRDSSLKDETAVQTFFQHVIQALQLEGNYLILLANDTYDIPFRAKDGQKQDDACSEVYSYILCSICPVKMTKPALSYSALENGFHNSKAGWVVSAPELGFLFPAFDDRSANLYDSLYYSRNIQETHSEFVDAVFHSDLPMPAAVQKETFQTVLEDSLAEDCSYEVVQSIHEQLCEKIETHKEEKEESPLAISKNELKSALESCGVSQKHVDAFEEKFDTDFGAGAELSPHNVVDSKRFEIRTPDVMIQVNPEHSDLIETRIIGGSKYILIRADKNVEVNGVNIRIEDNA